MQAELVGGTPALGTKLARTLQNDDFSDFALLQCEIPEFVWALTQGKRYFMRFPVEWLKPQAQIKQRAGDFNSCLLYTSPSPRDRQKSRMPSSA